MLISKIASQTKPTFEPVTVMMTAQTPEELELLVGFIFLDALDPQNVMTEDTSETLLDIAEGVRVNRAVKRLGEAVAKDFSLTVVEED